MPKASGNPGAWTPRPKQAAVLEAALDPGTHRSQRAICEAAKVNESSLREWLRGDPDFRDAWGRLWRDSLERHKAAAAAALAANAISGDTSALRLFFELSGDLKNRTELSGPDGAPLFDDSLLLVKMKELVRELPKVEPVSEAAQIAETSSVPE